MDLDALDKLRGALAAAGPWEVARTGGIDAGEYDTVIGPGPVDCMSHCYGGSSTFEGDNLATDAALIVAAVNALPDLIAEARKYRALREYVEDVLNHIPFQGPAGLEHRIRAALDAEP